MSTIIPKDKSTTHARVFVCFLGLPFVVGGLLAFYAMLRNLEKPDWTARDVILPGILGTTLVGVTLFLGWMALLGPKKVAEQEKLRESAPNQPWKWRADWAQDRVNSNTRAAQKGIWLFAILWNLITSPVLFVVQKEAAKNSVALLSLLFPLIGVGLLTWAVRTTLRAQRFGATWFEMSPLPAMPGGYVAGTIHARFSTPPLQGVKLRLSCQSRTFSGSGEDRTTHEDIVWRDERNLNANDVMLAGGEASIPVRFALPADALKTTCTGENDAGTFWSLIADASLAGIDYQDEFDIPVYKTGAGTSAKMAADSYSEQASNPVVTEPVFASDRAPQAVEVSPGNLARAGIRVQHGAEGLEFRFAAARNVSAATATTLFTLIWTGAVWLQFHVDFPWIFRIITGAVDLLLVMVTLDQWTGTTVLRIGVGGGAGGGQVRYLHTVLGIGKWSIIPFENIKSVDMLVGMQSRGRRGTPYYDVLATLLNGRHRTFLSSIRDKRHAEWILAEIRTAIGLRSQ